MARTTGPDLVFKVTLSEAVSNASRFLVGVLYTKRLESRSRHAEQQRGKGCDQIRMLRRLRCAAGGVTGTIGLRSTGYAARQAL
jgi:hypothetical protein